MDVSIDSDSVMGEFVGIGGLGGVGHVVNVFHIVHCVKSLR